MNVLNKHHSQAILDTTGDSLRLGWAKNPYLVKPNTEEAYALTGLPMNTLAEIAAAAAEIRKMGAQNVVVSMGKAGPLLQTPEDTWLACSPNIQEQNPIGAGDSMVGGPV